MVDAKEVVVSIVVIIVLLLVWVIGCAIIVKRCGACLPVVTPCAFFGFPCPLLGCFSYKSARVRRVKMSNGCSLTWSQAGTVVEEKWVSLHDAPAQRVVLRCDGCGNIVIPWGMSTSPYRIDYPPFAVLQGIFGKILIRTDKGCGCLLPKDGEGASGYELICDEQGRPMLPPGKNAVRELPLPA